MKRKILDFIVKKVGKPISRLANRLVDKLNTFINTI